MIHHRIVLLVFLLLLLFTFHPPTIECSKDTSSSSGRSFTPASFPHVSSSSSVQYSPCDETNDIECRKLLTQLLHKDLRRLQFPSSCSTRDGHRFLVFQYSKETIVNGFGAMFQFHATALAIAHAVNRTLIEALPPLPSFYRQRNHNNNNSTTTNNDLPTINTVHQYLHHIQELYTYIQRSSYHDPWLRAPVMACGGMKHTCYFEPSSHCTYTGTEIHRLPDLASDGSLQTDLPIVKITDLGSYHDFSMLVTRGSLSPRWYQMITCNQPSLQQQRQRFSTSPLWNRNHTTVSDPTWSDSILSCRSPLYFTAIESFLFRPKPYILSLLTNTLPIIQQASLVIGLHIRRGDAITLPWRAKAAPIDYLKIAHKIRRNIENRFSIFNGSLVLSPELSPFAVTKPVLYIASDSISAGVWLALNVTDDHSFVPVISPASLVYETPTEENSLYYTSDGILASSSSSVRTESTHETLNETFLNEETGIKLDEVIHHDSFRALDPLVKIRAKLMDTTTHLESYIKEVLVIDEATVNNVLSLTVNPSSSSSSSSSSTLSLSNPSTDKELFHTIRNGQEKENNKDTSDPDTPENNYHIQVYHNGEYERFIQYILYMNDILYNVTETERLIRRNGPNGDGDGGGGYSSSIPTTTSTNSSNRRLNDNELQMYSALVTYIYISNAIKELTDGVIMDIHSLSHTQYIIGTCLSQVSRISSELQYNYGYNHYPPIGLDTALCRERIPHPYSIQMNWQNDFDYWADD